MIKFVNAKINLGLNVVRKREDGYHDLETIFLPIGTNSGNPDSIGSLCDILEITPAESVSDEFVFTGNPIDCPIEKNLIYKALNLFRGEIENLGITLDAMRIFLEKNLPDGAGMGGGSADAAFTLIALNEINNNIFSQKELANMALKLGADCPFFIYNKPMYAEGVGEQFSDINIELANKYITIVKPQVSISTKEAFGNITPKQPERNIKEIINLPIERWKGLLSNDFETAMFKLHPEIAQIKSELYSNGAIYASMTGSGSAFYGIFNNITDAKRAISNINVPFSSLLNL